MATVFLEVWFEGDSLDEAGIEGRDEIEDPLDEALRASGLGQVTGGGGGELGSNIDVKIKNEETFDQSLALIRQVLRVNGAPDNTVIIRYEPQKIVYQVND